MRQLDRLLAVGQIILTVGQITGSWAYYWQLDRLLAVGQTTGSWAYYWQLDRLLAVGQTTGQDSPVVGMEAQVDLPPGLPLGPPVVGRQLLPVEEHGLEVADVLAECQACNGGANHSKQVTN